MVLAPQIRASAQAEEKLSTAYCNLYINEAMILRPMTVRQEQFPDAQQI